MSVEEGWHTVEDGKKLYTKTWKVGVAMPMEGADADPHGRRKPLPKLAWSSSTASAITVSSLAYALPLAAFH